MSGGEGIRGLGKDGGSVEGAREGGGRWGRCETGMESGNGREIGEGGSVGDRMLELIWESQSVWVYTEQGAME